MTAHRDRLSACNRGGTTARMGRMGRVGPDLPDERQERSTVLAQSRRLNAQPASI
jgi:hypothetical protein